MRLFQPRCQLSRHEYRISGQARCFRATAVSVLISVIPLPDAYPGYAEASGSNT
jgi:hypothetical protein